VASAGDLLGAVGDCIKAAREEQELTLEAAAELSGISKSHLSRLESGERQPSVASLLALAEAYGVTVGTFFGEASGDAPIGIAPADQPRRESNGLSIAPCSGYAGSSVIDALRVSVDPDRTPPPPARHPGEEWLYVLSGLLDLELDGEIHRLEPGTAAHFNAEVPHRLAGQAPGTEVLLVAAKPVRNLHKIH
jgi:quercetin dioxygenase-like cupin family protein/DNA-binding XRE family transcriptional regulator